MLKIIIIGPAYPLRGGIAESNHALHNSFLKAGYSSEIISYSLQYPNFLFPGSKQTTDTEENSISNIITLINTLNPFSWIKTAKYIISQQPNYVIVRYWHPYFSICLSSILLLLKKKSIFVIGWIDNIVPHESFPFQNFFSSIFIKSCSAFLVMSDLVMSHLKKYLHKTDKIAVVSPHPTYDIFGSIISQKNALKRLGINNIKCKNYILFFGLIRKYKGLDLLLDVMKSKRIEKLNIQLIVAGEFYNSKQKYEETIKQINHKEKRIFLYPNYVPNHEVVNFFCASDIVVQPYLSATQSGVSMIAYNFNKPLLLTKVGGLSEYINHGKDGYLVDVQKESIIRALEDFYLNNRKKSFSKFVSEKKANYGWDALVLKFNNIYEESNKS